MEEPTNKYKVFGFKENPFKELRDAYLLQVNFSDYNQGSNYSKDKEIITNFVNSLLHETKKPNYSIVSYRSSTIEFLMKSTISVIENTPTIKPLILYINSIDELLEEVLVKTKLGDHMWKLLYDYCLFNKGSDFIVTNLGPDVLSKLDALKQDPLSSPINPEVIRKAVNSNKFGIKFGWKEANYLIKVIFGPGIIPWEYSNNLYYQEDIILSTVNKVFNYLKEKGDVTELILLFNYKNELLYSGNGYIFSDINYWSRIVKSLMSYNWSLMVAASPLTYPSLDKSITDIFFLLEGNAVLDSYKIKKVIRDLTKINMINRDDDCHIQPFTDDIVDRLEALYIKSYLELSNICYELVENAILNKQNTITTENLIYTLDKLNIKKP